jgi:hypothetical protein
MIRNSGMRAAAVLAAAAVIAALAGCSTATKKIEAEAAKHGVEVIAASLTGPAALKTFTANVPLVFPEGYFGGAVQTVEKPFPLGQSNAVTATSTFVTPAGNLTVTHTDSPGYGAAGPKNSPPPAKWKLKGSECYFTAVFDRGTFVAVPATSTGKFAGANGKGVFTVIAIGQSPLGKGKTACSFGTTGNPVKATINFAATGHLKFKS